MKLKKPVVLIIRDGWGINPGGKLVAKENGDATLLAKTPFHDYLYSNYPRARLSGSGMDVGLPEGQMGNSEVGHLNLGAGRIVYQDLTRINKAIMDGEFSTHEVLQDAFGKAKQGRLHLLGLVSDGGVHSHQDHLVELCKAAKAAGVKEILVHAITDGRDTAPKGGKDYLESLQKNLVDTGAIIATVIGRYYAMDRDTRWERNQIAWDAIVMGQGEVKSNLPSQAIAENYEKDPRGDEFILPMIFSHANEVRVRDGDVVLWYNFRADRARQLSDAFLREDFNYFNKQIHPKTHYYTFTEYDAKYAALGAKVVFESTSMDQLLGQVIADAGLKQLRSAETEKYPHVTFFFNGGVETPFAGEDRYLAISPKEVATYDFKPQMSAPDVTFEVYRRLGEYDAVIMNFANPDMVGHTGVVEAGVHACETIDLGLQMIVDKTLALGGKLFITADHGNCEQMRNADGTPHTAHTTNLVHGIYVAADAQEYRVKDGILADVAPTILDMLGLIKPKEMTGTSLLEKK